MIKPISILYFIIMNVIYLYKNWNFFYNNNHSNSYLGTRDLCMVARDTIHRRNDDLAYNDSYFSPYNGWNLALQN